ncbi:MAG: hypothetical protein IPN34_18540 [Planctomycetes bacterium]|nr:hypothetical protein [Planctomycetota bacterium]
MLNMLGVRMAAIALLATLVTVLSPEVGRVLRPMPIEARATSMSADEMLVSLQAQKWPEHLALPAYYREPENFFLKKHRDAQSPLMNYWNAFSRDEKLEVLDEIRRLHTPFALPYLAEMAWFTLPQEADHAIAANVFSALGASSNTYVEVAIFVCDFVSQSSIDDTVVQHAQACRDSLVDRRQRLGR